MNWNEKWTELNWTEQVRLYLQNIRLVKQHLVGGRLWMHCKNRKTSIFALRRYSFLTLICLFLLMILVGLSFRFSKFSYGFLYCRTKIPADIEHQNYLQLSSSEKLSYSSRVCDITLNISASMVWIDAL